MHVSLDYTHAPVIDYNNVSIKLRVQVQVLEHPGTGVETILVIFTICQQAANNWLLPHMPSHYQLFAG